jgi:hypothetical protein
MWKAKVIRAEDVVFESNYGGTETTTASRRLADIASPFRAFKPGRFSN